MFCVQYAARTEMYRSVHRVSWASRRDNGRSNLQSAARLHAARWRLHKVAANNFQRFKPQESRTLKRFWVAPGLPQALSSP
jgi:hypothetical protein